MNEPQALPFHLSGNYAPVSEEITAEELEVIGRLPAALTGTARWYRNRWVDAPTTSNPHIVRHAGRTMALVETAAPVAIGAQLETLGAFDFDGALTCGMTAHPKTCPATGELQFFTYALEAPYLTYYRADAAGALIQVEPLEVGSPTCMHEFAITERFALFFDLPVLHHGGRRVKLPVRVPFGIDGNWFTDA